jgi:hypothetical protein
MDGPIWPDRRAIGRASCRVREIQHARVDPLQRAERGAHVRLIAVYRVRRMVGASLNVGV